MLKEDENNTHKDYNVSVEVASTNTSRQLVLLIRRKLDTGDPQDVPITVCHFTPRKIQFFSEMLNKSSWVIESVATSLYIYMYNF